MIDLAAIKGGSPEDGSVSFGSDGGDVGSAASPETDGRPLLIVEPVTDALKVVGREGRVMGSLDKKDHWFVTGFVIPVQILDRLPDTEVTPAELRDLVSELGIDWKASPREPSDSV